MLYSLRWRRVAGEGAIESPGGALSGRLIRVDLNLSPVP